MKALKFVLVILIVLTTVAVAYFKPAIHKTVVIESTKFAMEDKNAEPMTKQETIAWSTWRSNIGNKILKEKSVPQEEALNTINLIQFNVDNKGNIFNIKITTDPPKYNQIAQKFYIEYLNSLNGNSAIDFPKGSQRKVVLVKIPIKTSTVTKYSSPEDFSDSETTTR